MSVNDSGAEKESRFSRLLAIVDNLKSPHELQELAGILMRRIRWDPESPIDEYLFFALQPFVRLPAVDLAVLRRPPGRHLHSWENFEVLLPQRPPEDPYYPGRLHIPGTVLRGAEPEISGLKRLIKTELAQVTTTRPVYVGHMFFDTPRGLALNLLYTAVLDGDYTGEGDWHPLHDPPRNIIPHQRRQLDQLQDWMRNGNLLPQPLTTIRGN